MDTNINNYRKKVLSVLTPELLKPQFKYDKSNPTFGFCYIATEAMYHLIGKELGYYPVRGKDEEGITHWWLENREKERIDITAMQYIVKGKKPPYENGKRGGFLTTKPSKRCEIVIDRVKTLDKTKEV